MYPVSEAIALGGIPPRGIMGIRQYRFRSRNGDPEHEKFRDSPRSLRRSDPTPSVSRVSTQRLPCRGANHRCRYDTRIER